MTTKRTRVAAIYATTLSVLCPHCDAEQPDPDGGSDIWEPHQLAQADGRVQQCVSCDATFVLRFTRRPQIAGIFQ
jgi:hypothetical protein